MRAHTAISRVTVFLCFGLEACAANSGTALLPPVAGADAAAAVLDALATVRDAAVAAQDVGTRDPVIGSDALSVSSADMASVLRECRDVCRAHPEWSPIAACEDYGAFAAKAYFCGMESEFLPGNSCETKCSGVVIASPSAACRSAWAPFISCIAKAASYEETVGGSDLSCGPAVVSLMSNCWVMSQLQSARQTWMQRRPINYGYDLSLEATGTATRSWTIKVRGSQVVQEPTSPLAPSIDQIFEEMTAALQGGVQTLWIEVDGSSGILKRISFLKARVKLAPTTLDVDKVYTIGDFKAL